MKKLVTPTINLNGNTATSLIDDLRKVLEALRTLEDAMTSAADVIHGRNFQTTANPEREQREAMDAWFERWVVIRDMRNDVQTLAMSIDEQRKPYGWREIVS